MPLGTNPLVADELTDKPDVKLVTVPKKLPKNKGGDQVLAVEIQQLVIYLARNKLPMARHGKPFQ